MAFGRYEKILRRNSEKEIKIKAQKSVKILKTEKTGIEIFLHYLQEQNERWADSNVGNIVLKFYNFFN